MAEIQRFRGCRRDRPPRPVKTATWTGDGVTWHAPHVVSIHILARLFRWLRGGRQHPVQPQVARELRVVVNQVRDQLYGRPGTRRLAPTKKSYSVAHLRVDR